MADIFISYARPNEGQAKLVADLLRARGYSVWRDDELPAHRAYSEVIEERIRAAKAVVVLWSGDAARSQWVRAEADAAREAGTLVQISLDGSLPPMPFNQIQCADLAGWQGETSAHGWLKVMGSIASLAGTTEPAQASAVTEAPPRKVVICVLPFLNMSGDAEQEYFSDGISEDIITDLSKVSALTIIARNTAFSFKGKTVDNAALARDLGITHVLEGSVRKAMDRVRINAQLIDCGSGHQLWAERYDRDLHDIFAIQDEISKAIVAALQLKLLPREKKAIEHRGTTSPEAYNLYLMARQHWISGNDGDSRRDEVVVRICRQATTVDPDYAKAWALMALAQSELRFRHDRQDEDALASAERALALDPELAEAHCVKARYLADEYGQFEEADRLIQTALQLDGESWEVNKEAARLLFRRGKMREAVPYFEKAAALVETDYHAPGMLQTCYGALNDREGVRRASALALARVEKAVSQDPTNGAALGLGACALAALGEGDRAKQWVQRAMLIAPENLTMRYNLVCALTQHLRDNQAALDLLETFIDKMNSMLLTHLQVDPDVDPLREEPRYLAMLAAAKQRIAAA
ncbi:MAG: TIR domain-containing protein [Candidatus Andeanibacterium colombiense]|uniref:TIR domain-containing protein n=1 Tax=Candidatus Andeanibacterium colombiense TaxID=3121345 RepID=A0AAJ5X8Y0_9SPHN|nr:MAG: TIR domain-containing protein [Sphingomonadaceae bacterium]